MRTLLATAIFLSGIFTLTSTADAGRRAKRVEPRYYYAVPPPYSVRERVLCEERARAEDPAGQYAGYPCWARETFGRGSSGGRGR